MVRNESDCRKIQIRIQGGIDMELTFKPVTADDIEIILPFFGLRPDKTCESVFLDSFLWRDYYHIQYMKYQEKGLLWKMEMDGKTYTSIPTCRQEDMKELLGGMQEHFNQELGQPLRIYLADEDSLTYLNLNPEQFSIEEAEDLKDYLYDGEAMRTLAGRKLHKKKNHVNSFMRAYEGRYEFRRICCSDRQDVWEFLDHWREGKQEPEEVMEELDEEIVGIHEILKNCSHIPAKMAGVYIDGHLQAFSVGSYNAREKMAVIHIEKANSEFRGLYQFINQQFLIHEFPDAVLVNREDDVGLEGLRKSKMSYNPIGFARKFMVEQKWKQKSDI